MRISDWSSDVCSSDLRICSAHLSAPRRRAWGWAFPSAGRSSRPMAGGYGWNLAPVAARSFISHWRAWRGRGSMSGKGIVHLVDDEESLRRSPRFVLKPSGYGVVTYDSGPAFLQQVAHAEPGCVLLDVRMPELGGLEVQRALGLEEHT